MFFIAKNICIFCVTVIFIGFDILTQCVGSHVKVKVSVSIHKYCMALPHTVFIGQDLKLSNVVSPCARHYFAS